MKEFVYKHKWIIYPIFIVIILCAVLYFSISPLKRNLFYMNYKYLSSFSFAYAEDTSNDSPYADYTICYYCDDEYSFDIENAAKVYNNCIECVSQKEYKDIASHKLSVYFKAKHSGNEFRIIGLNDKEIITSFNVSPNEIIKHFGNIKRMQFKDIKKNSYCYDIQYYSDINELEYIYFDNMPEQDIIDKLNKRFPDCVIEYNKGS